MDLTDGKRSELHKRARILEYATIAWNVGEAGFTITLGIPRGKTFEDVIEYIVYNHDDVGYARLYPSEEFMNYQDGNDCVLERALRSGRSYKPVPLIEYGLVPGSEGGAP